MTDIELNKHHVNKKIKSRIPSETIMKSAGFIFKDDLKAWSLFRVIDDKYDIEFYVRVFPDDLDEPYINVVDSRHGQPYDYQYCLNRNKTHEFANRIKGLVEEKMLKLQDVGILSGHVYGEYI
jgi:hypothetical protein